MTRAYTCIIAAVLLAGCENEPAALTIAINAGVDAGLSFDTEGTVAKRW